MQIFKKEIPIITKLFKYIIIRWSKLIDWSVSYSLSSKSVPKLWHNHNTQNLFKKRSAKDSCSLSCLPCSQHNMWKPWGAREKCFYSGHPFSKSDLNYCFCSLSLLFLTGVLVENIRTTRTNQVESHRRENGSPEKEKFLTCSSGLL